MGGRHKMWNLYDNEKFLEPLEFSNGKTQEDTVREVLESIKEGHKIIFIRGMCGTGKSAIALNIAKNLGKSSIIVPGKNLQAQYKKDYEGQKYLLKENGEKLRISVITGRNNHKCLFLEQGKIKTPTRKKEVNSRLNDIFEFEKKDNSGKEDLSADNKGIPCKIEIKEKNFWKIKEYLKENKNVSMKNINQIKDVRRLPLASVCPYWSPVIPGQLDMKNLDYSGKKDYLGLNNTRFTIYRRTPGCGFYEQFNSYTDSDVIVFNSLKYQLESAINRKPLTEVEIIDECDEFLDSFSNEKTINLDRLQNSLASIINSDEKTADAIREIGAAIREIKNNETTIDAIKNRAIIPMKETGIYRLVAILLDNYNADFGSSDEENYFFDAQECAKMFEDYLDETYVTFEKRNDSIAANLVTINLAKRISEMAEKNKKLVLMSGTLHSELVLKEIFGLENFKIIDAETRQPGEITIKKTGLEMDCKYENFSRGKFTRERYLKVLDLCARVAEKPALIHVNSFSDLPTEEEARILKIENLIGREKLIEMQGEDREGKIISDFKSGKIKTLFTTKCSRGVDFPGEQCKSIIFTKFPNPNPEEPFWKILKKVNSEYYWDFYRDKARRELLQRVYRGLRFKDDKVDVLSPDKRVLDFFESQKNL